MMLFVNIAWAATGAVTQANMRISAVDGTAFVDFSSAGVLTSKIGSMLEITDSAGKKITGWIKAAGTGETYDPELLTNGNMELDSEWVNDGSPTTNERSTEQVHGGTYSRKFVPDAAYEGIKSSTAFTVTQNKLYRHVCWIYTTNAQTQNFGATVNVGGTYHSINVLAGVTPNIWTDETYYFCSSATSDASLVGYGSYNRSSGNYYVDDVSLKQVLTPSATGVTIVSIPGGATYNWASKESGFNYNDASGYTYRVGSYNVLNPRYGQRIAK